MESYKTAVDKIRIELTGNLDDVKQEFLENFSTDLERFIDSTAQALLRWAKLDAASGGSEEKAIVSGLIFSAITLHITSMRLFLTGYIVAAGNIQRQVLETLSLSLLCSCQSSHVLKRFLNNKYSSNYAVRDALRQADKLKVNKDSLNAIRRSKKFFDIYSHPSKATLASHISFSEEGQAIYVGSSFDVGKLDQYRKEMAGRVTLAQIIPNFVDGVRANVDGWQTSHRASPEP